MYIRYYCECLNCGRYFATQNALKVCCPACGKETDIKIVERQEIRR